MSSSSTEARPGLRGRAAPGRRVRGPLLLGLATAAGALAGVVLPTVGQTSAVLTDTATVSATITVRECDPTTRADHVTALAPVLEWSFPADALRPGDVLAPALPSCDPHTVAWDLAGVPDGGRTTPGLLPLASPGSLTLALLVDPTGLAQGGDLLTLTGPTAREVQVGVLADGALEVRYPTAAGVEVLTTAPLPSGAATHVVLTLGNPGVTVWLDGVRTLDGAAEAVGDEPLTLTVGALAGSGRANADVVVDEVLVLEQPLAAPAVAALHTAVATW